MYIKMKILPLIAISTLMACGTSPSDDAEKNKSQEKTEQRNQMEQKPNHLTSDASKPQEKEAAHQEGVDLNKVSEALGHFIGRNLNTSGIQFDLENIIKGMREGAAGKPAPMSDADYEKAMAELQQSAHNSLAESNLNAADKFMEENAHAKGVVVLIPGQLQYTILQEGSGAAVPEHGTPTINYTGKYINGTVFGSSENAGGPISVPLDQTIPGFSKGIAGMKEGEKRRLFVHPTVGYGRQGQLPPNSLLIFDIEVVKATAAEKSPAVPEHENGDDENDDLDEEIDAIEIEEPKKEEPKKEEPNKATK